MKTKMHTVESGIEPGQANPRHLPKRKIVDVEVVAAWVVAVCLMAGLVVI